jgi:hypothetical protein
VSKTDTASGRGISALGCGTAAGPFLRPGASSPVAAQD